MNSLLRQFPLLFGAMLFCVPRPMAQAGTCRLSFQMLNSIRHVVGEVNAECPPSWHSATWGNWGVESNFGGRVGGTQFTGWKWTDCKYQWNSCTRDHIRDTDCIYYNHDHNGNWYCEDQGSDAEYSYARFSVDYYADCPFDSNYDGQCDTGGCLDRTQFLVSNQYLTLYEMDWPDGDDYIGNLTVHSGCCAIWDLGCTARYCEGGRYSPMYPTISYYPGSLNTTANVRMKFVWGEFIDDGYCEMLGWMDIRYHCDEQW